MPDTEGCWEVSTVFCIAVFWWIWFSNVAIVMYIFVLGKNWESQSVAPESPTADAKSFSEHKFPVKSGPVNSWNQILFSSSLIFKVATVGSTWLDSLGIQFLRRAVLVFLPPSVWSIKATKNTAPLVLFCFSEFSKVRVLPYKTLRYHVLYSWDMLELDSKHQSQFPLFQLPNDCPSLRACLARIRSSGSYLTPLSQPSSNPQLP